jgi:hypothetical protein
MDALSAQLQLLTDVLASFRSPTDDGSAVNADVPKVEESKAVPVPTE